MSWNEQSKSATTFANVSRNAATFSNVNRSSAPSYANAAKNTASFTNLNRSNVVVFGSLTFDQDGADTMSTIRGLNGEVVGDLTFDSLVYADTPWSNQARS